MVTGSLYRIAVLSLWASLCSNPALAAPCDKTGAQAQGRPRIGLVLGGGGARGAAHVGVLRVLKEMHIPVDCIAGTSMGAIVGGLYASGLSPEEIGREIREMDWDDVLEDKPPRPERQFRRKRDDDLYLVKKQLGYESGQLELPLGYIQGQKLDLELVRLTQHVAAIRHFDELPIPFRAVATDIETGKEIVLSSGNLARAIRASMAVPGAFDAVEMDGRLLVDGLVTNNVPLDVARAMGADIAIVVNVGTPLKERSEITSALAIIEQYSNIVGQQNVTRQLDTLRETDIYIQPELGDISTSDFNRAADTIGLGADAAKTARAKLAKLAITSAGYSDHLAARRGQVWEAPIVGFVRIENQSKIGDDVLAHPFQALIGKPLDRRTLKRSIEELYGWNTFESIRYEIIEEEDKQGLLVHVRDKSWGPNYLQLGLALSTDLEGDSTWDIGVSLLKTALNRRAGELRLAAQIGESPLALAEFYQPLDVGLRYFITPQLFFDSRSFSRFEGGEEIEEVRVKRYGGGLAAGRVLGRWGEIRVGLRRYAGDGEVRIGDPATSDFSDFDFDSAEAYLRLYYDSLDNRDWPRSGAISSLEWIESVESLGADSDFSQLLFTGGLAHSWEKHTFFGGFEFDYTADGVAPVQNRFRTGGFTKLSGFTQDQLSGQQLVLLRSGYYRRLGDIKWLPAYAGVSLEYGNVYEGRDDISLAPGDALLAGSVFLGVDTVLGPVYLAYGHAEQGNDSIYLYLGRLF
ncbi:MAG: patatin-like phospholipase family protein [Pseudomonadota bacterium]|nr:patatin-like phospholipase family protein [Pseudomonadota bacterium]